MNTCIPIQTLVIDIIYLYTIFENYQYTYYYYHYYYYHYYIIITIIIIIITLLVLLLLLLLGEHERPRAARRPAPPGRPPRHAGPTILYNILFIE